MLRAGPPCSSAMWLSSRARSGGGPPATAAPKLLAGLIRTAAEDIAPDFSSSIEAWRDSVSDHSGVRVDVPLSTPLVRESRSVRPANHAAHGPLSSSKRRAERSIPGPLSEPEGNGVGGTTKSHPAARLDAPGVRSPRLDRVIPSQEAGDAPVNPRFGHDPISASSGKLKVRGAYRFFACQSATAAALGDVTPCCASPPALARGDDVRAQLLRPAPARATFDPRVWQPQRAECRSRRPRPPSARRVRAPGEATEPVSTARIPLEQEV